MNIEMKNPKDLKNPQEIASHLTHASVKQMNAFIWQRNFDGEINLNEKAKILKVIDNSCVRIEFENDIDLKTGAELFFALECGSLVFKSYVIEAVGKRVTMALPTIAKGVERRRSPRKKYKFEDYIDFELEIELEDSIEKSTAFLLDLSQHGMCLSLSDETVKKLELDQEIKLVRTNEGVNYTKAIVRSIRVFRNAKMGRNALYAVGLEFEAA